MNIGEQKLSYILYRLSLYFSGFVQNHELRSSEFFHFFTDVDIIEKKVYEGLAPLNDKNVKYVFAVFLFCMLHLQKNVFKPQLCETEFANKVIS